MRKALLIMLLTGGSITALQADDLVPPAPVLEEYVLGHGSEGVNAAGVKVLLKDSFFGSGTANSQIKFETDRNTSHVDMKVARKVGPGKIVPALLVDKVLIVAYNTQGDEIYAHASDGFTFGDSKAGRWQEHLNDLPAATYKIKITFVGNYE